MRSQIVKGVCCKFEDTRRERQRDREDVATFTVYGDRKSKILGSMQPVLGGLSNVLLAARKDSRGKVPTEPGCGCSGVRESD